MDILTHSNNLFFNIGFVQCFRGIQEILPGLDIIHPLPPSHFPNPVGLGMIILSLESFHDHQAAAELILRYQSLVVGFTLVGNMRHGHAFSTDTLLWVSQRENVPEVGRLLRRLADHHWPLVLRHQRQSTSPRRRAPLNPLERRTIAVTMKGQSMNQLAATSGISHK